MLSEQMQDALNEQVRIEAESSHIYLAMASWAEIQPGINNITAFFYRHSDEERMHMLKLIDIALQEKDYATHNFLQWYVAEQIEEEGLARTLNDKLELIGDDRGGLYLFDRDILNVSVEGDPDMA